MYVVVFYICVLSCCARTLDIRRTPPFCMLLLLAVTVAACAGAHGEGQRQTSTGILRRYARLSRLASFYHLRSYVACP